MPTCFMNAGGQPEFRSQLSRLGQRKHKCKPRQITKNCCYSSIPTPWISEYKLSPKILQVKTEDSKFSGQSQMYLLEFQRHRPPSEAFPTYRAGRPLGLCVWTHVHTADSSCQRQHLLCRPCWNNHITQWFLSK